MGASAISLEIGLTAVATVVLVSDLALARRASRHALYGLAFAGLTALFVLSFGLRVPVTFTGAFVLDGFALYAKRIVLVAGLLTVLATWPSAARRGWSGRSGDFLVLLLFSMVGAGALLSARELLTLFVGFELLSLPLYALAALAKERPSAPEGALKLFLFGSVSSALLLLGLGLVFGALGTTFWSAASELHHPALADLGRALVLAGFGFKVAMFPFYMWAPDTYQAAPTPVAAFLSVVPKAAGMGALFRLHFELFDGQRLAGFGGSIAVLAGLTMVVGNVLALPQHNLKRLLAYSGVAHIGYVLLALAAGSRFGAGMALFYFVAYLFSNMGAFLAVAAVEAAGEEPTIDGVRHLVRRSPVVAASLLVCLLSLGGIPFVLGFWGKMYVFLAAGQAGLWWLVFLGALLAVVALYYYLNVVRSMFIVRDEAPPLATPLPLVAAVAVTAAIVALGGLVPQLFVTPALAAVLGF